MGWGGGSTIFPSRYNPPEGLTLCAEVLTLEGVLRSAHHSSCGGFPESAIAQSVVCGPVGAAGAVVRRAGPGSASAKTGSARSAACAGPVVFAGAVAFPRPRSEEH